MHRIQSPNLCQRSLRRCQLCFKLLKHPRLQLARAEEVQHLCFMIQDSELDVRVDCCLLHHQSRENAAAAGEEQRRRRQTQIIILIQPLPISSVSATPKSQSQGCTLPAYSHHA